MDYTETAVGGEGGGKQFPSRPRTEDGGGQVGFVLCNWLAGLAWPGNVICAVSWQASGGR